MAIPFWSMKKTNVKQMAKMSPSCHYFLLFFCALGKPNSLQPPVSTVVFDIAKTGKTWSRYALEKGLPILAYAINPSRIRGLIV